MRMIALSRMTRRCDHTGTGEGEGRQEPGDPVHDAVFQVEAPGPQVVTRRLPIMQCA
jgi:hypothetical protein